MKEMYAYMKYQQLRNNQNKTNDGKRRTLRFPFLFGSQSSIDHVLEDKDPFSLLVRLNACTWIHELHQRPAYYVEQVRQVKNTAGPRVTFFL